MIHSMGDWSLVNQEEVTNPITQIQVFNANFALLNEYS
jgi:hypothetical protein